MGSDWFQLTPIGEHTWECERKGQVLHTVDLWAGAADCHTLEPVSDEQMTIWKLEGLTFTKNIAGRTDVNRV